MKSIDDLKYIKTINNTLGKNNTKEALLDEMVSDYNAGVENTIMRFHVVVNTTDGKDVYVNDSLTPIRGVIDTKKKQGAKSESEQSLQVYPNLIKTGDVVRFKMNETDEFHNYLITSDIDKKRGYDEVIFLECNQTLNLKGWDKPIPCVASNDSYGVKLNESVLQFSFRDAKMKVQVQKNSITKTIKNGTRFIFDNSEDDIYRVIDKSSAISSNIIVLMLEKVETKVGDDFVNNIACNDIVPDTPTTYNITGVENIKIGTQQTFTLQPISTGITWEIDDLTIGEIISQDSTSCIIKGKGTTDELLTLNAIQNSVIIATKYINITTR